MSDIDSKSSIVAKPARRAVLRRASAVLPGLPSDHQPPATPTIAFAPVVDPATVEPAVNAAAGPVAEHAPVATPVFPPAAVPAVHPAEDTTMDAVNTTTDTANTTAAATDRSRALFADWTGRSKDAMEKGAKAWDELGAFYKGNMEAMVEASRIAAKGMESIGQHAAELTRKSMEDATGVARTLSQTKSPTEFMKLQGDFVRSAFDAMVAETSRSTETMLKLAGDVAQPVANRVALASDKIKTFG